MNKNEIKKINGYLGGNSFYFPKSTGIKYIVFIPDKHKIIPNRFVLGKFNAGGELKEIRIYTDTAKTRLYKSGIIAKLNFMIEKTGDLTIEKLPKRIRNKTSKRIKFIFITAEDTCEYKPVNGNDLPIYNIYGKFKKKAG